MPHAFEVAPTGRAKCRACRKAIAKDELRFGERLPNPFGEGEMTLWFHVICGACTRPEPWLEALQETQAQIEDVDRLKTWADAGLAHRRLPRLIDASRAPTGRARCRQCRELIEKDLWRLGVIFYQEGRFEPAGYLHVGCAGEYFETTDLMGRLRHFADLSDEEFEEIEGQLN